MKKLNFLLILALFISFVSCVDLEIDEPPVCCEDVDIKTNASIADIKALYSPAGPVQITEDLVFRAVVAADDASGNFYKGIIIQDENDAIELRIDMVNINSILPQGRELYIKAQNLYVGEYNGNLQLSHNVVDGKLQGIPEKFVDDYIIRGNTDQPVKIYDANINSLGNTLLSQPVRFSNVEFTESNGTYADADNNMRGFLDLTDCEGNTVTVVTSGYAKFAGTEIEPGNGEFIGIYTLYNGEKQLIIRNPEELNMKGERCSGGGGNPVGDCSGVPLTDPVNTLNVDFSGYGNKEDVELDGWANVACEGSRRWQTKVYNSDVYMTSSSYNSNDDNNVVYLITPLLNITNSTTLSFKSAVAFYNHDGLQVLVSNDYDGSDVTGATWTELPAVLAGSSNANYEWVNSGNISLADYVGTGVVAFRYEGSSPNTTTTAAVDDISITQ